MSLNKVLNQNQTLSPFEEEGLPQVATEQNEQSNRNLLGAPNVVNPMTLRESDLPSQSPSEQSSDDQFGESVIIEPMKEIAFLQQEEINLKIQNQIVTPIDTSEIVQTVNNSIVPKQIITVRKVFKNVFPDKKEKKKIKLDKYFEDQQKTFHCPYCKGALKVVESTQKPRELRQCDVQACEFPLSSKTQKKYFGCLQCGKDFCMNCPADQYLRHKLSKKTSQHSYFRRFIIDHQNPLIQDYDDDQNASHDFDSEREESEEESQDDQSYQLKEYDLETNAEDPLEQNFASVVFWKEKEKSYFNTRNQNRHLQYIPMNQVRFSNPLYKRVPQKSFDSFIFLFLSDDRSKVFFFVHNNDDIPKRKYQFCFIDCELQLNKFFLNDQEVLKKNSFELKGKARDVVIQYFDQDQHQLTKDQSKKINLSQPRWMGNYLIIANQDGFDQKLSFFKIDIDNKTFDFKHEKRLAAILNQFESFIDSNGNLKSFYALEASSAQKEDVFQAQNNLDPCQRILLYDYSLKIQGGMLKAKNDSNRYFALNLVEISTETWQSTKNEKISLGNNIVLYIISEDKNYLMFDIEGWMNFEQNRTTIIVKNFDWATYIYDENQRKWLRNFVQQKPIRDAQIIPNYELKQLLLAYKIKAFQQTFPDCQLGQLYQMVLCDLETIISRQDKVAKFDEADLKAAFGKGLKNKVFNPNKLVMYFILQEENIKEFQQWTLHKISHNQNNEFQASLFAFDIQTNKNQVFFVNLKSLKTIDKNQYFKRSITQTADDHGFRPPQFIRSETLICTEYPIMCYTGLSVHRFTLNFVNLQKNIPQIKINLGKRILFFIRSYSVLEPSDKEITIYFEILVKAEKRTRIKSGIQICLISVQPFAKVEEDIYKVKFKELFTGHEFTFNYHPDFERLDDIIEVFKLNESYKFTGFEGESYLLQSAKNVTLVRKFQKPKPLINLMEESLHMIPHKMIRFCKAVLFLQFSDKYGCQIMCVKPSQSEQKIKTYLIWRQREKILQMQASSVQQEQLLVLDSSYRLKFFYFENEKLNFNQTNLSELKMINLANCSIKRCIRALDQIPFVQVLLSQNGIVGCLQHKMTSNNEGDFEISHEREITFISIDGSQVVSQKFLCFLSNFDLSKKNNQNYKSQVVQLKKNPGLSKVHFQIQEGNFQYILTDTVPTLRRFDLIQKNHLQLIEKKDQKRNSDEKGKILLLKKAVLVNFSDRILIFNTENFILQRIYRNYQFQLADEDFSLEDYFIKIKTSSKVVKRFFFDEDEFNLVEIPGSEFDLYRPEDSLYTQMNLVHSLNYQYYSSDQLKQLKALEKINKDHLDLKKRKEIQEKIWEKIFDFLSNKNQQNNWFNYNKDQSKLYFYNKKTTYQQMLCKQPQVFRIIEDSKKKEFDTLEAQLNGTLDEKHRIYISQTICNRGSENQYTIYDFYFQDLKMPDKEHPKNYFDFKITEKHIILCICAEVLIIDHQEILNFDGVLQKELKLSDYLFPNDKIKAINITDFQSQQSITSPRSYKVIPLKSKYQEMIILNEGLITKKNQVQRLSKSKRDIYQKRKSIFRKKAVFQDTSKIFQICFQNYTILWDMENNCEIETMHDYQDFLSIPEFIPTAFRMYFCDFQPPSPGAKAIRETEFYDFQFFQANVDCSLFRIPKHGKSFDSLFRTYSHFEICLLNKIEKELKEQNQSVFSLTPDLIPNKLLTLNVKGQTFFSLITLLKEKGKKALEVVYEKLDNPEFETESGLNFDLFMRQVYYTLKSPYQKLKNNAKPTSQNIFYQSKIGTIYDKNSQQMPQKDLIAVFKFNRENQQTSKKDNFNIVQLQLQQKQIETFNYMMRVMLISPRMLSIRTLISTFDDFKTLFNIHSHTVDEFMENIFIDLSLIGQQITLTWPSGKKQISFTSNTAMLSREKLEKRIKKKLQKFQDQERKVNTFLQRISLNNLIAIIQEKWLKATEGDSYQKEVSIKACDISWLIGFQSHFYNYLSRSPINSLFENELIKTILETQNFSVHLIFFLFIPQILYIFILSYYFMYYVPIERQLDKSFFDLDELLAKSLWTLITFFQGFSLYVEYLQFMSKGNSENKLDYFYDSWNYQQLLCIFANQFILVEHQFGTFGVNHDDLIFCSIIMNIVQWILLLYAFQIFKGTAFYSKLIAATIENMKIFMLFYIYVLFWMSSTLKITGEYYWYRYINEDPTVEEYYSVENGYSKYSFMDSFVTNWLLALGDFSLDYLQNGDYFPILYFVIATFLTNIVFLNMLIAIMSDTYTQMSEKKERLGLQQNTSLYADYMCLFEKDFFFIKSKKLTQQGNYLFIVSPSSQSAVDEEEEFQHGFQKVSSKVQNLTKKLSSMFQRQNQEAKLRERKMGEQFIQIQEKQAALESQLKIINTELTNGFSNQFDGTVREEAWHPSFQTVKLKEKKTNTSLQEPPTFIGESSKHHHHRQEVSQNIKVETDDLNNRIQTPTQALSKDLELSQDQLVSVFKNIDRISSQIPRQQQFEKKMETTISYLCKNQDKMKKALSQQQERHEEMMSEYQKLHHAYTNQKFELDLFKVGKGILPETLSQDENSEQKMEDEEASEI